MAFDTSLGFAETVLGRGVDYVRLGGASRFRDTTLYGTGNSLHFGRWKQPDAMIEAGQYSEVIVPPGANGRPDLVAFIAYRDTSLWWVICFANGIDNVLTGFKAGMTVKIPSRNSLERFLSASREAGV